MRASAERNEALGVRNEAGTEEVASTQQKAKGTEEKGKEQKQGDGQPL